MYILAIGGYGNDGESDLILGALYIPGGHPLSGSIFIRTPPHGRTSGRSYVRGFSDSDPQPLIKGGKRSPDRTEVFVSSNPVIIPRELADWVMGGLDLPGVALPPLSASQSGPPSRPMPTTGTYVFLANSVIDGVTSEYSSSMVAYWKRLG